jgi:hypothetical protein
MVAINTQRLHHFSTLSSINNGTEKKSLHSKHTTRKIITKYTNMKKHDKKIAYGCFALLVFYSPTLLHARVRVIRFEFFCFFFVLKFVSNVTKLFLLFYIYYGLWMDMDYGLWIMDFSVFENDTYCFS